jgi:signal transduction histidine kinase
LAGALGEAHGVGGDQRWRFCERRGNTRLTAAFRDMAARIVGQVQKLKQTDVLRRELVANVSHDLKTPLASLQGYVDTLLLKDDTLTPEERRNYLGVASRSCERLATLVADLIEMAKLDAHEVTPQAEPSPARGGGRGRRRYVAELMNGALSTRHGYPPVNPFCYPSRFMPV